MISHDPTLSQNETSDASDSVVRARAVTIDDVIVAPPLEDELVDPGPWFGAPGDVELEIGCGKGGFLLRRAQAHPEINFVGIEWANKMYLYTADRMSRWSVRNVRIIRTDAAHFVKRCLAAGSLSALHVYHPDPWPKKRHHKRRLIQPDFADAAVRVLKPGGRWAVQTDHRGYFEQIQQVLCAHTALRETPFDDPAFGTNNELTETNYEIKYLREGRPIYRIAVVRTG